MLVSSIILITLALLTYTTGIWAEKFAGHLRPWHAATFVLGLIFDASGTFAMTLIKKSGAVMAEGQAATLNAVMSTTGALALILMALHATWAIAVLIRKRPQELQTFHRISLVVWAIWLVPYFAGMAASILG